MIPTKLSYFIKVLAYSKKHVDILISKKTMHAGVANTIT